MADVFLSYARPNERAARRIAEKLGASGLSVWFDEQIPAHRDYSEVIEEQLSSSAAVVVLWSREAVESQWVRSEANRARETKRLVQARLDDVRLPMPFDQIQCADLRGGASSGDGGAWRTVESSVAALVGNGPLPRAASPAPDRRRLLLAGGAAAVLAAGGFAAWRGQSSSELSPEAQLLLQKGLDALQANDALDPEDEGSTAQAIALLTEATRAAPGSAIAWGGLAMGYAVRRRSAPVADRAGLEARGRSAAQSALRIDDREPRALAALLLMDPVYQHWASAETGARRALARNPKYPILLFVLSDILGSVGRWRDATELSNQLDRKRFLLPGADRKVIVNLWSASDLQAADEAASAAAKRWPDQRQIWRTRIAYLMYSGRASEALAILGDVSARPLDVQPDAVVVATATAKALIGETSRSDGVAANLAFLNAHPDRTLAVAHATAALGDQATVFDLLDGYYFGTGRWAALAPPGGNQDRLTGPLFQPPMRGLWRDPRFAALVERIGLTKYWRRSGTRPDYQRLPG